MACLRFKTKTAEEWTEANPTLRLGVMGLEVDDETDEIGLGKLGDGVTAWNDLAYFNPAVDVALVVTHFGAPDDITVPSSEAVTEYAHPLVTPATHIDDPTGAVTDQDDEARAAIGTILDALEAAGIVEPAA